MLFDLIASAFVAFFYWIEAIFRFFFPRARKNVKGEIVLITGAGSGIGQRLSIEFAKLGSVIVGWDVSSSGLKVTEEKLEELGFKNQWHSYTCDITDRQRVYETAEKVNSEVGNVTMLINNAGIVSGKRLLDCSDEMIVKTMEVNVMAHFWTIKAFLPAMIERNKGHIVTTASAAGMFGIPGVVDYCASKFAAIGLAEALNIELKFHLQNSAIKSTIICPYFINTGMFHGVSDRLLKMTKLDDAIDQMVDGVLRDKFLLCIPKILYTFYGLRGLLPDKSSYVLSKSIGVFDSMTTFVGRKKAD